MYICKCISCSQGLIHFTVVGCARIYFLSSFSPFSFGVRCCGAILVGPWGYSLFLSGDAPVLLSWRSRRPNCCGWRCSSFGYWCNSSRAAAPVVTGSCPCGAGLQEFLVWLWYCVWFLSLPQRLDPES